MIGLEARESAASTRAASAGVAGAPSKPVAGAPAPAPGTRGRPGAGTARSLAPRVRGDMSDGIYEDEEDIYGIPSRGRVPAPARPAKPRGGREIF
ncbi:hypothetical protein WME98_26470 [Sorangium sp. So ce296]|uniref:hypothetical protein n=1 Tax=Sorangium sp. So ce296 TaxID=3133296 RepID=UPI003F5F5BE7